MALFTDTPKAISRVAPNLVACGGLSFTVCVFIFLYVYIYSYTTILYLENIYNSLEKM